MSLGFTKLFGSITTSTIWSESNETRIVWITMLSMADRCGRVWASIPGLARVAAVPVDACREAIALLLAPDPDSRTKDYDGRRIEAIDGGWVLLNYLKYRQLRDEEDRRATNREASQRHRARQPTSADVSRRQPDGAEIIHAPQNQPNAEAEAEADPIGNGTTVPSAPAKPDRRKPETACPPSDSEPDVVSAWAARWKIPTEAPCFEPFLDHHRKTGARWRDWSAAWRTWLRNEAKYTRERRLPGTAGASERARVSLDGFKP
jgi:hypothetical protein